MDNQYDHESITCRFVSLDASLPSLQVIASNAVALSILYNFISRHNLKNLENWMERDFLEVENGSLKKCGEMIELLKTPKSIEKILQQSLKRIWKELLKCLRYFQSGLFNGSLEPMAANILNFDPQYCVWHSNGAIDYRSTVSSLLFELSVSRLDVVQKFVIMCNFCMENELETFDLTSLPKNFSKEVDFEENPLVYYWIRRSENDWHEIILRHFHSIDAEMALKCLEIFDAWLKPISPFSLRPRNAFKYFWNRMDPKDQISIALFLLEREDLCCGTRFGEILSMLSWYQQCSLLSQVPDRIVLSFCFNCNSSQWMEIAFWAWTHSKNRVTTEQFRRIVVGMLREKREDDEAMNLLIEIWRSAPNRLQNYVVEKANHEIASIFLVSSPYRMKKPSFFCYSDDSSGFSSYYSAGNKSWSGALKFFHKFLSAADANFRKRFILSKTVKFGMLTCDPELYREMLDLCLPNSNDLLGFKISVMNSIEWNNTNERLISQQKFGVFETRLKFYIPNPKAYQEYVKLCLLQSQFHLKSDFVHDEEAWSKLSGFIDDLYSSDETSASELKKLFITSLVTNWSSHGDFGFRYEWKSALNVLQSVFSSEELMNFKQMFLENLARLYVDESYWQKFSSNGVGQFCKVFNLYKTNFLEVVPWCLGDDDEAICEFKKDQLPVHVLYKRIFHKTIIDHDHYDIDEDFDNIDEILISYVTEEKVKEYKLNGIDNETICYHNVKDGLRKVLMWLFGGNEVAVDKMEKLNTLKAIHFRKT